MDGLTISPLGLFMQAGLVGKFVMSVLFLASIWCWVLIAEGIVAVIRLSRAVRSARRGDDTKMISALVSCGGEALGTVLPGESVGELRVRIQEAMNRAGRDLLHKAEGGLPNLAVISSVAPFIGLFGTVWGIMSSFAGIAAAKDTSLAVVAPGIAEALAATAFGLAAAIPAAIGYNRIGASLGRAAQNLSNFIEERAVTILSSRKLGLATKDAA